MDDRNQYSMFLKNSFPYLGIVAGVGMIAWLCHLVTPLIGYHSVGFVFLFFIMVAALFLRMGPAILAALLSAMAWNFFFMPPKYTFVIYETQDMMMFFTYFVAALTIGMLTTGLKKNRERYEKSQMQIHFFLESEKFHKTLLSCVSHELKTPLTSILGAAMTMQSRERHDRNVPTENKMLLAEIISSSTRLNHIFENLLDMTRLESGFIRLSCEWFNVSDLVQHVTSRLEAQLSGHLLQLDVPDRPVYFFGDFGFLEHALANLIANAACYSPKNSTITVAMQKNGEHVSISVVDRGSGIPEQYRNRLFEKFFRLPGTPSGGLGLGLSITKNLVELHKGAVEFRNNALGGSTFTINLPYVEPPQQVLESES